MSAGGVGSSGGGGDVGDADADDDDDKATGGVRETAMFLEFNPLLHGALLSAQRDRIER